MDEQNTPVTPAPRERRRRKTKMELFKEAYLPYIILLAAIVLILIFIVGALVRNANARKEEPSAQAIPAVSDILEI